MRLLQILVACTALTIGCAMHATPLHALELPAPELTASFPPDQGEVEAPISEITLIFAAEADLVSVTIITPDQRRLALHDAFGGSDERKGDMFVLSLPEPVSLPGTYLIEIAASVSDPTDSTASALGTMTSFTITAPSGTDRPSANEQG